MEPSFFSFLQAKMLQKYEKNLTKSIILKNLGSTQHLIPAATLTQKRVRGMKNGKS